VEEIEVQYKLLSTRERTKFAISGTVHVSADPNCGGGVMLKVQFLWTNVFSLLFAVKFIQFCESLYPVQFTVIKGTQD
jgi:hypothetical protein